MISLNCNSGANYEGKEQNEKIFDIFIHFKPVVQYYVEKRLYMHMQL